MDTRVETSYVVRLTRRLTVARGHDSSDVGGARATVVWERSAQHVRCDDLSAGPGGQESDDRERTHDSFVGPRRRPQNLMQRTASRRRGAVEERASERECDVSCWL